MTCWNTAAMSWLHHSGWRGVIYLAMNTVKLNDVLWKDQYRSDKWKTKKTKKSFLLVLFCSKCILQCNKWQSINESKQSFQNVNTIWISVYLIQRFKIFTCAKFTEFCRCKAVLGPLMMSDFWVGRGLQNDPKKLDIIG